ncbi:helix-turn-helix domain-containing protein [Methylobacter psychrophilus]|uniref:hypothetical protein n=1 Tax=Methylobacter psychrophilus TaxID=96941 RepID=UPI0021D4EF87|nr:hypothetical protein [Methylobacter psychrophilus]
MHQVISEEGFIAANTLAKVLHITQSDLAEVTGLSRDSVSKNSDENLMLVIKRAIDASFLSKVYSGTYVVKCCFRSHFYAKFYKHYRFLNAVIFMPNDID